MGVELDFSVDTDATNITTRVSYFTVFAVLSDEVRVASGACGFYC